MNSDLFQESQTPPCPHWCKFGEVGHFLLVVWMLLFWIQYIPLYLSVPSQSITELPRGTSQQNETSGTVIKWGTEPSYNWKSGANVALSPAWCPPGVSCYLVLKVGQLVSAAALFKWEDIYKPYSFIWKSLCKSFISVILPFLLAYHRRLKFFLHASLYFLHHRELCIILHVQNWNWKYSFLWKKLRKSDIPVGHLLGLSVKQFWYWNVTVLIYEIISSSWFSVTVWSCGVTALLIVLLIFLCIHTYL